MKTNVYDQLHKNIAAGGGKVLLHACCAPCASVCLETLGAAGVRVSAYYYNPNIMPMIEYEKRGKELERLCGIFGTQLFVDEYANGVFLDLTKGLEAQKEGGERCKLCYKMRLLATAVAAKRLGYDYFATTLTLSPHKNADVINAIGFEVAKEVEVDYLASDFKKRGGYQRSIVLCKEFGLYRQNYCGCAFGG